MTSNNAELTASCLCGGVHIPIKIRLPPDDELPVKINLCHCTTCRRSTGVLCTSYAPIASPTGEQISVIRATTTYRSNPDSGITRYFCSRCGCHVLRSRRVRIEGEAEDGSVKYVEEWEVATGVMSKVDGLVQIDSHIHLADTKDGGVSSWIRRQNGKSVALYAGEKNNTAIVGDEEGITHPLSSSSSSKLPKSSSTTTTTRIETLKGTCNCGAIRMHLHRPNAQSKALWSPFSDLIIPFHAGDHQLIKNPRNEPWWLRDGETKYLAGTCACRSCRLISGFEIQTWAFVPRVNISVTVVDVNPQGGEKEGKGNEKEEEVPLDFNTLPRRKGGLTSYKSSPGVIREFCGTCGATVFWHDEERPDLIDVSVGLLDADTGARAEGWLDWFTERVSFEEDPEIDRPSQSSSISLDDGSGGGGSTFDLIPQLKRGLAAWGRSRRE